MLPLTSLPSDEAALLRGLLFDLDDTLLDHGRLARRTYVALCELAESGLSLIAVTGRPARWAELLAGLWPVDAVIAENGALAFRRHEGRVMCVDTIARHEREARSRRLLELVRAAREALPELVPADDTWGRLSDFAFDIGEHQRASSQLIRAAEDFAHAHGARTTRSSVHLHYTFDRHDKATGATAYLALEGVDPTLARFRYAYVGDSTNDAPCFAAFHTSVGVQNISGTFSLPPRYVTRAPRGEGFAELASCLLAARSRGLAGSPSPASLPPLR